MQHDTLALASKPARPPERSPSGDFPKPALVAFVGPLIPDDMAMIERAMLLDEKAVRYGR